MKTFVKDFILISVGAFILSIGYNYFLVPNSIAAGGASGVATILHSEFGIHVSLTVLVINAILFG